MTVVSTIYLLMLWLTKVLVFCSYRELSKMGDGLDRLCRHSTRTYKGRMYNQNGAFENVMIQWQSAAADFADGAFTFADWVDRISQLQHPNVLPIVGACLEPPATISPFMQVGMLSLA